MNEYVARVSEQLKARYATEPEYLQSVQAWLEMVAPVLDRNPAYEKQDLLTRMVEPERMVTFLVPWVDDQGTAHTNHGYRVQFNSAIGPYKGGLRFHPSVNAGIVKFLGFEQTYKNALTGLPIGGAAGGADFDPRGKSNREIMRFCQSFMIALYRYIGADTDVPAGDIGVGAREIGYLYGEYKRLTGRAESSALTGKGLTYGGSKIRLEAAGFGAVYFLARMLEHHGESLEGKRIAVSGFGNMSWGVCRKAHAMGAKVVTLSGPDGYVYDPAGVNTQEKFDFMAQLRSSGKDKVQAYADRFGAEFHAGRKPWEVPVDIAMPCATQNELDVDDAVLLLSNDVKYYVEAANMPATAPALKLLRLSSKIRTAGAKAAGSGGVAVSALEMVQNSLRYSWSRAEVDRRLQAIMAGIYDASAAAAQKYGLGDDLIAGNDIAAFEKISAAMLAQGPVRAAERVQQVRQVGVRLLPPRVHQQFEPAPRHERGRNPPLVEAVLRLAAGAVALHERLVVALFRQAQHQPLRFHPIFRHPRSPHFRVFPSSSEISRSSASGSLTTFRS
jgi:glutamate dehydrogenase (NADP+)